ncbi:MAG: hypothetical protein P4M08_16230 [Oligoflexia bacterium]|nr:hypothetical protein [Oligoflexia bacterium]
MRTALFTALFGTVLAWGVGTRFLDLSLEDVGLCILAAQIAGLLALLFTLRAEKNPLIRRYLMNRSLKTWGVFLTLYFGTILWIAPVMRNLHNWLWLTAPLMLTDGFCILIFGPIQDRWVRHDQRRAAIRALKS